MDTPLVSSADTANALQAASAATQTDTSTDAAITSDFETFLTLLTAQLENQDPLKPLESTEFVAQLAQFSAVEQQVRSNDTLEEILSALNGGGGAGLSDWLGSEVRAEAALVYSGDPVELTVTPDLSATSATLVVSDLSGAQIARVALDPKAAEIEWDGTTGAGATAPNGSYRFTVERVANGVALADETPSGFAPVAEARLVGGDVKLVLESGDLIAADTVQAVRLPPSEE